MSRPITLHEVKLRTLLSSMAQNGNITDDEHDVILGLVEAIRAAAERK